MRILVAIDGSKHSEVVVDEIARRPFPADSEVQVISVIEPPYWPLYAGGRVDMQPFDVMESASREGARAAGEKAATKLRAGEESRQLNVTTKVLSGSPKGVILEEAEAFGADLIVLGSHGYGWGKRFLFGSVALAVVTGATCSVEIVRRRAADNNGQNHSEKED